MSTRSNIRPSSALLVFTILPLIFQCLAHDWARHMQRTSTEVTAQPDDSCMHSPNSISQRSLVVSVQISSTERHETLTLSQTSRPATAYSLLCATSLWRDIASADVYTTSTTSISVVNIGHRPSCVGRLRLRKAQPVPKRDTPLV